MPKNKRKTVTDIRDAMDEAMDADAGVIPQEELSKELLKDSFPSNCKTKPNDIPAPEKKTKSVAKGRVLKKKKTLGDKISETFFAEGESVVSYIVYDIIIPAAKGMIADAVTNGIEMKLFGEVRGSRTKRDKGKSYVSYSSFYSDKGKDDKRDKDRDRNPRSRVKHTFDDIGLETRGEAEEVLSHLVDLIDDYGMASVADLYDLVGVSSNFTDDKYGWDNLSTATVVRDRGEYVLKLPRTKLLE